MTQADDALTDVALTEEERYVLDRGLVDWRGPAVCSDELARAMGFENVSDFLKESGRLLEALRQKRPLSRRDWTRVLLATEIVFISDVVGSGVEWETTTGISDLDSLKRLRSVQRKLAKVRVAL
jgi:hypothetical protein